MSRLAVLMIGGMLTAPPSPILVLATGPAFAQSMSGDMKGMSGVAGHGQEGACRQDGAGCRCQPAIDTMANKLAVQRGPIPAVGWPAMTMAFKANPPTLLRGPRVGQRIGFDVKTQGMAAEVTAVQPQ